MSEYEWEIGRFPRAPDGRILGGHRSRNGPVAEYVALEFPRESVTWVANPVPSHVRERPATAPPKGSQPGTRDAK